MMARGSVFGLIAAAFTVHAVPMLAQSSVPQAERHALATAIFSTACMRTAPDLAAAEAAFLEAGLVPEYGVHVGFGKEVE